MVELGTGTGMVAVQVTEITSRLNSVVVCYFGRWPLSVYFVDWTKGFITAGIFVAYVIVTI